MPGILHDRNSAIQTGEHCFYFTGKKLSRKSEDVLSYCRNSLISAYMIFLLTYICAGKVPLGIYRNTPHDGIFPEPYFNQPGSRLRYAQAAAQERATAISNALCMHGLF